MKRRLSRGLLAAAVVAARAAAHAQTNVYSLHIASFPERAWGHWSDAQRSNVLELNPFVRDPGHPDQPRAAELYVFGGKDGFTIMLEMLDRGRYHLVERFAGGDDDFETLCRKLMDSAPEMGAATRYTTQSCRVQSGTDGGEDREGIKAEAGREELEPVRRPEAPDGVVTAYARSQELSVNIEVNA